MKRFLLLLVLLGSLFLASTVHAQQRRKVACVGNSITEGVGVPAGQRYPDVLQRLLGEGYEVRNFGVSARTLLRAGDHPYWNEQAYRDALAWAPDIVVIKLGTNDSKPQNWKYGASFRSDYTAFIRSFRALPTRPAVYLCTPIPVFEDRWGIRDSVVRGAILPLVRKAARKTRSGLIDAYTPFSGRPQLVFDGVHPNAEGCALLAEIVFRAIRR